jgi:hypothetical protein
MGAVGLGQPVSFALERDDVRARFCDRLGGNDRLGMYRSVSIGNLSIDSPHLTDELPRFRNSGNVEKQEKVYIPFNSALQFCTIR